MGNSIDELASYMKPKMLQFQDACERAGVPVRIVDTGRTPSEQTLKIQTGVSWTKFSKHEPQAPEEKSEAFDAVPLAILAENKANWDPGSPLWLQIGAIGETLGLFWGGRWKEHPDPSHFQWQEPPASAMAIDGLDG